MGNRFNGPSWIAAGERMNDIREAWEERTYAAAQSDAVKGDPACPIDAIVQERTSLLQDDWYNVIGEAAVGLGSTSSRMLATGRNYASSEDQSVQANERFWDN